jgi:hypothetical protein
MIGLWTARKYDIPVDRTFTLVNRRFRTSQGAGGTWDYNFVRTGANGSNAMTCIALLGVAIGHVVAPEPNVKPETDTVIVNAFTALSKSIGAPTGDLTKRTTVKAIGGLYFLWAMERIAVLYDVRKLGSKDWYQWGAEILLSNQLGDGSWEEGGFPGENKIVNTCLALMFLRRANLTPDLSKKLVVDPGTLLAKVDDKIAPKPEPPPPSPKVEEPKEEPKSPPPPKFEEPKQAPKPTPTTTPSAPTAQTEAATSAPPAKRTPWPLIILGMLVAGVAGGGLAFFVAKRMKKDDEDGEKKKKGKKKAKAEANVEKSAGGKKAKAKVQAEDD